MSRVRGSLLWAGIIFVTGCGEDAPSSSTSGAEEPGDVEHVAQVGQAASSGRTVTARVVALDQPYVYNRFGAFNPVGMIYALERDVEPIDAARGLSPGNVRLRAGKRPRPLVLRVNVGDRLAISFRNLLSPKPRHSSSPATRRASIHVDGLQITSLDSLGGNVGKNPSSLVNPGDSRVYEFVADREGTFLMHSAGAMSGGQGDGGQLGLGLFGAINVEPPGSVWFRSQVTAADLAAASMPVPNPDGTPRIDYDAEKNGAPVLRILDPDTNEIVHGDLTAIVSGVTKTEAGTSVSVNEGHFRELTVLFHDELRVVQAFPELDADPTLQSIRDAFGVNYGASGLGAELLANRKRIGPTKDCVECKFEEFFLSSWANGDPAMNVDRDASGDAVEVLFPDDPSNVHHSYLSDPVRIRNVHAGPKETHVFHLHAHQWFREPGNENATLLDSQSVGPGAGFTYNINFGSGNRGLTPGDAILHCHLYPHFAQGMWGLWRVHDVFENGGKDRNLPDGEIEAGTPTPAVVPIPGRPMPPLPTYASQTVTLPDGKTATRPAMPGYPHYIGAIPGHRPSQPPLDMDHDGGLPRHLITRVPPGGAIFGERGEFDVEITRADLKLLPKNGTDVEQRAIQFHAGGFPGAAPAVTRYGFKAKSYPAFTPEGAPGRFLVNGQPPKPGAPYADPCPVERPERNFRIAFLQTDGVVNKAGWHDPQMRIKVLEQDIEATLKRTRPLEPLYIRAHSGDCVVTSTTNLVPAELEEDDFQIFTPTDTLGEHVHLVKFDVTSSDGAANGFNYEDGTFAAEEVVARIEAANKNGGAFVADGSLTPAGARVQLAPAKHPRIAGAPLGTQSTWQRWWADPLMNAYGKDRAVRTAFAHDHLSAASHQQHGLYSALVVEPAGTTWRDPASGQLFGTRADGGPTSFRADILYSDARKNHREFNLAIADFALVYDAQGNPVNPPTAEEAPLPIAVEHAPEPSPEAVSERDPGTQLFNYRNEPIPLRIGAREQNGAFVQRKGAAGQMENVFRTAVHGDPFTPILEAYARDRVRINLIQGAHEEQHVFSVHGVKWLAEPFDPDSGYVNSQGLGISEHFEFILQEPLPSSPGDSVDHLYQSTPTENLWDGLWGLLRVFRHNVKGLLPLPGNQAPFTPVLGPPACPANAPARSYTVHAVLARDLLPEKRTVYNPEYKLHDPDGMLFVREEHLEAMKSGLRKSEPLILRAAAGDCIKVTLVNDLPQVLPKTPHWNYNTPLIDGFNTNQVASSNHVGLHAQLVAYDVDDSDGANIGKNSKQTVAPNGSRTYTWYAGEVIGKPGTKEILSATPIEFGVVNLRDMADVVNHGMHGSIGALVVEPLGASWTVDAGTEAQATVTFKDPKGTAQSFREHVVIYQDEVGMHSDDPRFQCKDGKLNCGTAIRNFAGEDDAEDSGHKAFNYRSEPIWARLGLRPETPLDVLNAREQGDVLSSLVHGDPATPVFTAKAGMPLRIRVAQPSGHARQHAYNLWGHEWPFNPWADGSRSTAIGPNLDTFVIGTQSVHSVMRSWNILPIGGAGGPFAVPGDYLYRDHPSFQFTDGLWGIMRVTP